MKVRYFKMIIPLSAIVFFTFFFACNGNEHQQEQNNSKQSKMMNSKEKQKMMEGKDMMQQEMMSEEMRKAMMSKDMGPEMMKDMHVIRLMLMNHKQINRRVENLDNGVKTWTTSDNPEIAGAIQKHVRQMKERMEEKNPIRQMDPLFNEIFKNAHKIELQIIDIENGVKVVETSDDPEVVKLIQQHANKAVSEFVDQGMQRAMQPTPLPEGYKK